MVVPAACSATCTWFVPYLELGSSAQPRRDFQGPRVLYPHQPPKFPMLLKRCEEVGLCYTLPSANSSSIWQGAAHARCEYWPHAFHGPDLSQTQIEIMCQNTEQILFFPKQLSVSHFSENLPLLLLPAHAS